MDACQGGFVTWGWWEVSKNPWEKVRITLKFSKFSTFAYPLSIQETHENNFPWKFIPDKNTESSDKANVKLAFYQQTNAPWW